MRSFFLGCGILLCALQASAATISGSVKDSKGEALTGVSIILKGTLKGTTSDGEGNFHIESDSANDVLQFSFLGYTTVEKMAKDAMFITLAEDALTVSEVVVSTQKRNQTSIEVPVAVSAMAGDLLEKMNIVQMDEMSQFIPGLEIQLQSPNNPGYVVRGVTSDSGSPSSQPRVSIYMDGVSLSRSRGSAVELFDVERVEVVKGPQGTLFGRGSQIGAIHTIRNKPSNKFEAEVAVNYGTYNQHGVQGYINTPIIEDKLANRFAISYDAHDGYIDNLYDGSDLNGKSALAVRNSTRLYANDRTIYDLVIDYQHDNYPGTSFKAQALAPVDGDSSPFTAASLDNGGKDLYIKRDLGGATFTVNHDINSDWSLTSITAGRAFNSRENFDADGTYLPLLYCEENAKGSQYSQEIRFNYDNGGKFRGFFGANYFYEDAETEVVIDSNMQYLYKAYLDGALGVEALLAAYADYIPGLSDYIDEWTGDVTTPLTSIPDYYGVIDLLTGGNAATYLGDYAPTVAWLSNQSLSDSYHASGTTYGTNHAIELFADGSYDIIKNLSLTGGIRVSYEMQQSGYSSDAELDPTFGALLYTPTQDNMKLTASDNYLSCVGRVALNYMFNSNNAYVSFSRGRRPGVISVSVESDGVTPDITKLAPETILSYEAGLKGYILNGKMSYDVCVYYYDWSNFQTYTLEEDSDNLIFSYVSDDAGKAHTLGVELGTRYAIARGVELFGNYNYIQGEFNDVDEFGNAQEYAGNTFRLTPKHSFAVGLDIDIPLSSKTNIYFRPSYTYKSKHYFDDSNEEYLSQDAYGLANATLGVAIKARKQTFDISLYGKNLLDEDYLIDAGNSGDAIGFPTYVAGAPRTMGVQFKVKFQ